MWNRHDGPPSDRTQKRRGEPGGAPDSLTRAVRRARLGEPKRGVIAGACARDKARRRALKGRGGARLVRPVTRREPPALRGLQEAGSSRRVRQRHAQPDAESHRGEALQQAERMRESS